MAFGGRGKNNGTYGIHTGAGSFVVRRFASRCYEHPDSVTYENELLDWLTGRLPVRLPQPIRLVGDTALIPWFAGDPVDLRRLDHLTALGESAGMLAAALADHPPIARPGWALFADWFAFPDIDPDTVTAAHCGLADDAPFARWRAEVPALRAIAADLALLPKQVAHLDVTAENVLVADGPAAILDFEFMTVAPRLLEIVQPIRNVLFAWDEPWDAVRALVAGYRRHHDLTPAEWAAVPAAIRLRAAGTALWWLAADPSWLPARIDMCRWTAEWVATHGDRLREVLSAGS